MGYEKKVVAAVNNIFSGRREMAFTTVERHRQEACQKIPQLQDIERQLSLTAMTIAREAVLHKLSEQRLHELRQENLMLQSRRVELLVAGGFPPDYLTLKFHCKKCEDLGYVGTEMCSCYKEELIKQAYHSSVLASAVPDASFAAFQLDYYSSAPDGTGIPPRERMAANLEKCKQFAFHFAQQNKSLLLQGPTGLGKTFLSGCISKELVEQGVDVMYDTAHNIFSILERDKFNGNAITREEAERVLECELLIIDDLGTEFITAFSVSALYNLINTRLLRHKLMIINTNCEMKELEKLYTPRVASRLVGEFTLLKFYGEDIRFIKEMRGIPRNFD